MERCLRSGSPSEALSALGSAIDMMTGSESAKRPASPPTVNKAPAPEAVGTNPCATNLEGRALLQQLSDAVPTAKLWSDGRHSIQQKKFEPLQGSLRSEAHEAPSQTLRTEMLEAPTRQPSHNLPTPPHTVPPTPPHTVPNSLSGSMAVPPCRQDPSPRPTPQSEVSHKTQAPHLGPFAASAPAAAQSVRNPSPGRVASTCLPPGRSLSPVPASPFSTSGCPPPAQPARYSSPGAQTRYHSPGRCLGASVTSMATPMSQAMSAVAGMLAPQRAASPTMARLPRGTAQPQAWVPPQGFTAFAPSVLQHSGSCAPRPVMR